MPSATTTRPSRLSSTPSSKAAAAASLAVPLATIAKTLGYSVATARERFARLTDRERQVAGLMAKGKPNRVIAEELGISPKTLDIHRGNVQLKLEARTSAAIANLVNLVVLAGPTVAS